MLACHRGGGGGYLQYCGGICDLNQEFVLDSSEQNPEGPQIPPVVYTGDKSSRCRVDKLLLSPDQTKTGYSVNNPEEVRGSKI